MKFKIPKAIELRLKLYPISSKPIDDGRWKFVCSFPKSGTPDMKIIAKTSKRAKEALADFIYNEMDGKEDIDAYA